MYFKDHQYVMYRCLQCLHTRCRSDDTAATAASARPRVKQKSNRDGIDPLVSIQKTINNHHL